MGNNICFKLQQFMNLLPNVRVENFQTFGLQNVILNIFMTLNCSFLFSPIMHHSLTHKKTQSISPVHVPSSDKLTESKNSCTYPHQKAEPKILVPMSLQRIFYVKCYQ